MMQKHNSALIDQFSIYI